MITHSQLQQLGFKRLRRKLWIHSTTNTKIVLDECNVPMWAVIQYLHCDIQPLKPPFDYLYKPPITTTNPDGSWNIEMSVAPVNIVGLTDTLVSTYVMF